MPFETVNGATLQCTMGLAPSSLIVLPLHRVMAGNQPAANITDHVPIVNIAPFGMCTSLANPVVASATSAALGVLTPMPCIPNTPAPWVPGEPTILIDNMPALNNTSKCNCVWAGVISIVTPGQTTVMIGSSGGGGGGAGAGAGAGAGGGDGKEVDASSEEELPWLSWKRLEASLESVFKNLFGPGDKKPELEIKYELKKGELLKTETKGETTFFGIPMHSQAEGKVASYEAGAKAGAGKDGVSLGAYGEFNTLQGEAGTVIGSKNAGGTLDVEGKVLGAEAFAGIKDNEVGAVIGFTLASVKGTAGVNIAGANVGVSGEVGLKLELGFKIGAEEVEVKLPFITVGISFGAAK